MLEIYLTLKEFIENIGNDSILVDLLLNPIENNEIVILNERIKNLQSVTNAL